MNQLCENCRLVAVSAFVTAQNVELPKNTIGFAVISSLKFWLSTIVYVIVIQWPC